MKYRILKIAFLDLLLMGLVMLIQYLLTLIVFTNTFTLGYMILNYLVDILFVLIPSVAAIVYSWIFIKLFSANSRWYRIMVINLLTVLLVSAGIGFLLFSYTMWPGNLVFNFTGAMICTCILSIIISFIYKRLFCKQNEVYGMQGSN